MSKKRGKTVNGIAKLLRHSLYRQRVVPNKKRPNKRRKKNMDNEDDNDDAELALDVVPENNNVRVFTVIKNDGETEQAAEEAEYEQKVNDALTLGLETFLAETQQNCKGFLAVVFDGEKNHRIIWAGEVDMISSLGSLEVAKHELFRTFNFNGS